MDRCIYLGNERLLVRTNWDGYVVVPSFNVDVAIGAVRDGVIEPWTTRLVQELLRPGMVLVNGGANYGYYSSLGAHIVGSIGLVIAVDANPYIIPYLLLTRAWAGRDHNMKIFHRALWTHGGEKLRFTFDPQYLGGGHAERVTEQWGAKPIVDKSFGENFSEVLWSAENLDKITDPDGEIVAGRGMFLKFDVITSTIDEIVPSGLSVDLIHLDIEGAETAALLGASQVFDRSPHLRLITEWSASRTKVTPETREMAVHFLDLMEIRGYRVRELQPTLAEDGGIFVSEPLSKVQMLETAVLGDYVWCKPQDDPWAR